MNKLFVWTACVVVFGAYYHAAASEASGPLRVHPENPRYFMDGTGKAILLTGAHTWNNLVDMGQSEPPPAFDFDAYLNGLTEYGHNFIRGWAWEATRWNTWQKDDPESAFNTVCPHPWVRTGPGEALDGKAKFDLERIDPGFLDRLKMRAEQARARGIYLSVMLFEGYSMQFYQEAWAFHPFNAANNINGVDADMNGDGKGLEFHQLARERVTRLQESYVREVVAALNGLDNILYEISNETCPDSTEWQYHMIRFIKECEKDLPKQHPVGMTYQYKDGTNEALFNSPADWVSPNHAGGYRDNPPDAAGRKVILSDTDHLWGIGGDPVWVWKTFTRGLNPVFMDPYGGSLIGAEAPQFDALRKAMGHVLQYSRRIDLAKTTPQNAIASTGYCLAEPGVAYLALAPDGGSFTVDLTASKSAFSAEWHNPLSGDVSIGDSVSGGEKRTFSAPFDGPAVLFLMALTPDTARPSIVSGDMVAPHRGVYEVKLVWDAAPVADPYLSAPPVTFTLPDASTVQVDSFFDGIAIGGPVFKARAYCVQAGHWSWSCGSQSGSFRVEDSALPGKLRIHPEDPYQFAYDNGQWYLHLGDTGYRYVVSTEPEWQAYIDQAASMGATKIRTWFCQSRSGVEALFTPDRAELNLPYWQEIDRRLQYALNRYPHIIFQLIPYGEDAQELARYAQGDVMARLAARYAQARFSALPNVTWCVSNDQTLAGEGEPVGEGGVSASVVDGIGRDMDAREPWGTLLTNHQARYTGYAFTGMPWSDITTFEDLDQAAGALLLTFREQAKKPVVNEEDRYEIHERPEHATYYFRRLMWASLLSGGHATFGGARTYEPYDGVTRGVRGYYDLIREGILTGGADSFRHILRFFYDSSLTFVGMQHADHLAGGNPLVTKVIASEHAVIAYLANPDSEEPGTANAAGTQAECALAIPSGTWRLRWFNPQTGLWVGDENLERADGSPRACKAPFAQDAVLLAVRFE
ncbi:MAG: DUF4038 domain-containing protein [Candidatus Hydrogenedentes bacterium]|nr:DUF4038 domain-containing protein [Candidatus Hydrogenedentota bacterium]